MANMLRLLIVSVFFITGIIIGNVYLPQKNFDTKNIVLPQKPKASFNVENAPSVETVLKEAEKYKNLLIASGQDQEEIIGFENNFKRTILQLYYKEAAANYALELLKIQLQPEHTAPYIKTRTEYKKLIDLIESLYPLEEHKEVIVIKEDNPAPLISTQTVQSTQTIQIEAISTTDTAKAASSTTTQTN